MWCWVAGAFDEFSGQEMQRSVCGLELSVLRGLLTAQGPVDKVGRAGRIVALGLVQAWLISPMVTMEPWSVAVTSIPVRMRSRSSAT